MEMRCVSNNLKGVGKHIIQRFRLNLSYSPASTSNSLPRTCIACSMVNAVVCHSIINFCFKMPERESQSRNQTFVSSTCTYLVLDFVETDYLSAVS